MNESDNNHALKFEPKETNRDQIDGIVNPLDFPDLGKTLQA